MKTISKKIFIYVLCGLLSVSACSCNYMRSVYAFEYVGGALAFEEALKWLLGAIGIVSAGGMTADYWENHGREFEEYCAEQELTNQEVTEWQMKLCQGILDKGSGCWSAFKTWAKSLISSGSSGETSSYDPNDINTAINDCFTRLGVNAHANLTGHTPFYAVGVMRWSNQDNYYRIMIFNSPGVYSWDNNKIYCDSGDVIFYRKGSGNVSSGDVSDVTLNADYLSNYRGYLDYGYPVALIGFDSITTSYNYVYDLGSVAGSDGGVSDGDMDGLNNVDTENLDIINSDIVDEEDTEVSLPMPGLGTSDDTISSDTYDDIIGAINDGTISIDDGVTQIQELLRVIVYDDTTDDVIPFQPDPDTGGNKKKDDVIQENKNNMGFTLFGLENVFPFCIPWDIYAFLSVLNAEPVAPVLNIPFPNVNDPAHPLTVRVDLSDWDNAARIVRLAEDFLFIVGLAFLTRSMIGAGGDD